jgi:hypothetical protein
MIEPQVGEIWILNNLGRDFYHIVVDTTEDPDYIILGFMVDGEVQTILEYRNSFTRARWRKL